MYVILLTYALYIYLQRFLQKRRQRRLLPQQLVHLLAEFLDGFGDVQRLQGDLDRFALALLRLHHPLLPLLQRHHRVSGGRQAGEVLVAVMVMVVVRAWW